jgi:hypothetical protein
VKTSWESGKQEIAVKSFKKCGISNALDDTDSLNKVKVTKSATVVRKILGDSMTSSALVILHCYFVFELQM